MKNLYAFATQFTRQQLEGKRSPQVSLWNRKEYRSASMKEDARRTAYRAVDGSYHSATPVRFHPEPRNSQQSN